MPSKAYVADSAMDDGMRRWLYKTAHCRKIRPAHYDFDDLIQDGQLIFVYLHRRYPTVNNPAAFMRLFQVSYLNHLASLGRYRYHERSVIYPCPDPASVRPASYDNAFMMVLRLKRAPSDVASILDCLHSEKGQRRWRATYRIYKDGTRETFNDRLCRMIGLNPSKSNLPVKLQAFLDA